MTTPIVRVVLEPANYYGRRHCLFCDNSTDDECVNAVVYSHVFDVEHPGRGDEQRTGRVVCSTCLNSNDEMRRTLLREQADWHAERAAELRHLAEQPPALPAVADLDRSRQAITLDRGGDPFTADATGIPF